jgi:nitrogen fixation/metabolism regulation signal transduction histidine kinase
VIRLRHKLTLVFLATTLVPLAAILWVSSALMERSLGFVGTDDTAVLSQSLEKVAREYYRQARERLKEDALAGRLEPRRFPASDIQHAPLALQQFWESADAERFMLDEPGGERLNYLVRHPGEVWQYSASLGAVRMGEVTRDLQAARSRAGDLRQRDLPRGFTRALILLGAIVWLASLAVVIFLSNRISRPVQQLTAGLRELAAGRFDTRLESRRQDEVGLAIDAFNHTAAELRESHDRLVYLTQVASWQMLARKMAHELKNSLTPIRLTVEEIVARQPTSDRAFLEQAAQVVVDEVESIGRRVRAFSEFAAEPPVRPEALNLNALLEERVQFLQVAHPEVAYRVSPAADLPCAWADPDQVKGILTNVLENAAEAAGAGGAVLGTTGVHDGKVVVEVHDSGPGLSREARLSLFEPSISFKKRGMGLGLAISRKNALLAGGDLQVIEGRLGGAAFRLLIPLSNPEPSSSAALRSATIRGHAGGKKRAGRDFEEDRDRR